LNRMQEYEGTKRQGKTNKKIEKTTTTTEGDSVFIGVKRKLIFGKGKNIKKIKGLGRRVEWKEGGAGGAATAHHLKKGGKSHLTTSQKKGKDSWAHDKKTGNKRYDRGRRRETRVEKKEGDTTQRNDLNRKGKTKLVHHCLKPKHKRTGMHRWRGKKVINARYGGKKAKCSGEKRPGEIKIEGRHVALSHNKPRS